ncbi:SMI1/KNR4 family protein [Bacillus atrophaeus]|uniref:SMI1/KNR4 family protein n=1 Tax=Bacillus atrophaeus TaxID=1452 RepID=UPI0022800E4A|nr:SMI1/KNR4 family protein [Bacillus atrophaeus]MCY8809316.1 SMI1/KNR4 family protein [Bacillus atrophaeus]MCY8909107.1 SMI1/KNR4 family protein [Bacillus atrophaeus]MEC0838654.1 SMI1/KNR4 family protein [Bacillus atrophaeus]MEC0847597.1 SMI1/KNR4 family protein [Bacillus atrophaeus]MEC0848536.1 SMI1/KNR4 family protein [Bacillus atrophaeus]
MSEIWENSEYDPFKLKDISEDEIKNVEQELNLTLPEQYKKLIIQQNGGLINFNAFPTDQETSWADDHIEVDHIRGIGKDLGILESEYLIKEWGLPQRLLLIQGDGHNWVALDYRLTNENPPVHYFDLELNNDFKIADSFDEFLSKLYTHEYEEVQEDENLEFDKIHNIDPNDPDAIQKEKVEKILANKSHMEIHRISLFPIQSFEDLEWLLNIIKDTSIKAKGDMAFELADVLMSIVSSYSHQIKSNNLRTIVQEAAQELGKSKNEDTKIILDQLKDFL